MAAAAPALAISCRQGEFNNQQGREAATEGSGVGTDGRTMMVIWNGRREAVGVGRCDDRAAHVLLAAILSRWRLREQALDSAMRPGGARRRT